MIRSPLRQQILTLSGTKSGVSTKDISGYTIKQVGRAIDGLVDRGLLFSARDGTRFCRYFSTASAAAAFTATIVAPRELYDESGEPTKLAPEFVAGWAADEPVIYPPDYKHTVFPPSRMGEFVTNTHKDW